MARTPDSLRLEHLIRSVAELREDALALESEFATALAAVEPGHRDSARNLVHYVSVRRHDIRRLQTELSALGLSSLGRMEAHTLATLESVLAALHRLAGGTWTPPGSYAPVGFRGGPGSLAERAAALLGPAPAGRDVRIMVTMPSEAATDAGLVRRLVAAGMDVMRINCAHDDPDTWMAMAANLRRAERDLDRRCRLLCDLAGPKLRTGAVASAGRAVKFRPRRDLRGAVVEPARLALVPAGDRLPAAPPDTRAMLPIVGDVVAAARADDHLEIADGRGRPRRALIVATRDGLAVAESRHTTYVVDGALVRLRRGTRTVAEGVVRGLPEVPETIVLGAGDRLVLTRDPAPGRAAKRGQGGTTIEPARIPCTLEAVFGQVRVGERVWFDDGKIGATVELADGERIVVRVDHVRPGGTRLRADKGINLPDSELDLPALTPKDLADLEHLVTFTDIVGLSFVRRPEDIHLLEERLHALAAGHLGIVLKVENRQAFEHLPRLLIAGQRSPPLGVMVARGDLAVEVGFERLAEVQEEMLWMCEAAHVPVIWATQVLERLARTGAPSRAEITDAAMSGRAECVMLNKGPHVVEAVEFLSGVLERMAAHQTKKTAMLRKLAISRLD